MLALIYCISINANVRIPKIVGDNMVLQGNEKLTIWGWADKAEKISIQFNGQFVKTVGNKEGKWSAELAPMKEGGPFDMIIKGKNVITLKNILIGDVWICSVQSNMAFTVEGFKWAQQEAVLANNPRLRMFNVPIVIPFPLLFKIKQECFKAVFV